MSVADFITALQREAGAGKRPLPPVERWNPERCGAADFEIRADGTWYHEGTPIGRESLVRLFASILRKDADGETYLVTPAEKERVRVADAHFVTTRADRTGAGRDQTIAFTTNVGDVVVADAEHPIELRRKDGELRPYIRVRGRLEAKISRTHFYDLAEWGEDGPGGFGVWSAGGFFLLDEAG